MPHHISEKYFVKNTNLKQTNADIPVFLNIPNFFLCCQLLITIAGRAKSFYMIELKKRKEEKSEAAAGEKKRSIHLSVRGNRKCSRSALSCLHFVLCVLYTKNLNTIKLLLRLNIQLYRRNPVQQCGVKWQNIFHRLTCMDGQMHKKQICFNKIHEN